MKQGKKIAFLFFIIIFTNEFSLASAVSPAGIIAGIIRNAVSYIAKKLWSLVFARKKAGIGVPKEQVEFERGYRVQTFFDGTKHGIKPYSVQIGPTGELLILDSVHSNMHKISLPLSRCSKIEHVAGSSRGYRGHVDGEPEESRMYNPRGFTIDDSGNIYIADTSNKAIRKISKTGVKTIAGGRWKKKSKADLTWGGDFSDDFDVVYASSLCSLLVVDRGKQVIREIQLPEEDCTSHHPSPTITYILLAVIASAFFCYMLALLQSKAKGARSTGYRSLLPNFFRCICALVQGKAETRSYSKHQPDKLFQVPRKGQANKYTIKSFTLQTFGWLSSWFERRTETEQPVPYCNEKNTVPPRLHTKASALVDGNSGKSQQVKRSREHELQQRVKHNSLAAKANRERKCKYTDDFLFGDTLDEED